METARIVNVVYRNATKVKESITVHTTIVDNLFDRIAFKKPLDRSNALVASGTTYANVYKKDFIHQSIKDNGT
jgi:hypothetical protein